MAVECVKGMEKNSQTVSKNLLMYFLCIQREMKAIQGLNKTKEKGHKLLFPNIIELKIKLS